MQKRNRISTIVTATAATLMLASAFAAMAGSQASLAVSISDPNQTAQGSLTAARYSADDVQFISCANSANTFANCIAKNAAGVTRSCVTSDPALIAVISSIGPESYVSFRWNDEGQCASVRIVHGSQYKL